MLHHGIAIIVSLASAAAGVDSLHPNFSSGKIGNPDWITVYSHLSPHISMTVEEITGQSFDSAATLVLNEEAPADALGKATYFRSCPIDIQADKFWVEWSENVNPGKNGMNFELWSGVGKKPNQLGTPLLVLANKSNRLMLGKDVLTELTPGWRRFKIVVSSATSTFDFYFEDMDKPLHTNIPLSSKMETTVGLGIGFILYVTPRTEPSKWQVGGITVEPL